MYVKGKFPSYRASGVREEFVERPNGEESESAPFTKRKSRVYGLPVDIGREGLPHKPNFEDEPVILWELFK
jgi:hypothetical protein